MMRFAPLLDACPLCFAFEITPLGAFAFNAAVTALVVRHVFAAGRVTARRVQGAVPLYLNIAALFAIAFGELVSRLPGSITSASGAPPLSGSGVRTAALACFSITTITATRYGDLVPVHPLARSLATLEAVVGRLFPATLPTRHGALPLAHHDQRPTWADTRSANDEDRPG